MDNLVILEKVLCNPKHPFHNVKAGRSIEEEIQMVQNQMAEINKDQRSQFRALSKLNQRRICELVGLEYLSKFLGSTEEEVLPAIIALGVVNKPEEVLPDGMNMFQKVNERVEAPQGVGNPLQVSEEQTKASRDGHNALQGYNKQAETRWNVTDVIQIPRQDRTSTLKGSAIPLAQYLNSPPALQMETWSSLSDIRSRATVRPVTGSAIPFPQIYSDPPSQGGPWPAQNQFADTGSAMALPQIYSDPPSQGGPWSLNESQHRTAAHAVPGSASCGMGVE